MNRLQSIFLKGLFTLLPVALTVYILLSVIQFMDNFLGAFLQSALGKESYIRGLGFLLTLLLIFGLGLALESLFVSRGLKALERGLLNVPFIRAIYSPLRDLMNLFSKAKDSGMKSVVLVRFGEARFALGIVTRENLHEMAEIQNHVTDHCAVYLPLSYGVGGVTLLIPRSQMIPLDLPIERAMSLAITGWVLTDAAAAEVAARNFPVGTVDPREKG